MKIEFDAEEENAEAEIVMSGKLCYFRHELK
jgi:hypothetical protein